MENIESYKDETITDQEQISANENLDIFLNALEKNLEKDLEKELEIKKDSKSKTNKPKEKTEDYKSMKPKQLLKLYNERTGSKLNFPQTSKEKLVVALTELDEKGEE